MRPAVTTVLLAALFAPAAGCEWLRKAGIEKDNGTQVQGGPLADVTAGELVAYLNRQADLLHAVRYNDVYIDVHMGREHNTLGDSTLICAKPRNFLLVGGRPVVGELIHIGSNDREFWMLTKRPLEPSYVYCSHDDFRRGAGQLPIPFDPDWALEALGMAAYDPGLPYRVETDQRARLHTLSVETTTPQGVPVRKEVVLDPYPHPRESRPHVRQHRVLDRNNNVIAMADVKESATLPAHPVPGNGRAAPAYVQVPTRVVLEWPQQQTKMELRLGRPRVNERLTEAEMATLFTRPQPRNGVNPINLAEARFFPSNARGAAPGDLPRRGR
jgi:hypothetical protein